MTGFMPFRFNRRRAAYLGWAKLVLSLKHSQDTVQTTQKLPQQDILSYNEFNYHGAMENQLLPGLSSSTVYKEQNVSDYFSWYDNIFFTDYPEI